MIVNGWTIFGHPLLLDQLERVTAAVEKARATDPAGYQRTAKAKLLAILVNLIFETIPADPTRPEYRQGDTLGAARKHWFRAKFGNGRFRQFFRFDSKSKIIIFAWVDDETTLRTYGAKTDAYRVFKGMLDNGNPPDDWMDLLAAASEELVVARLEGAKPR
ncbi:MAG: type II toxin-antitoxin system YhaV family toxin [Bosea sp. (in: a-proteobacteria)]|uniref:type II toxin-antitoxin system YhaV family toxin n=1 Tax=Bosea sp. (in: a-proteobacteria) TaxID=1871050 RepID=UPI00273390CC|nr:type II toxin-antitoxin system YhaV family toxin [Bosea sp. (in: a-proteobacteria)]MDP3258367.1 type II toxin-antitoxin system YhaV family toxin [Bosea sp. (in: a-proteobacteria)]MDP3321337.1 type II toxin-antitoxin system YhaV family toxin [Bosea sp. (in: a-proteobacteria)]